MRATSLLIAALVAAPHVSSAQAPAASAPAAAPKRVRHTMQVTLDPKTHRLTVNDEIALPAGAPAEFLLNGNLRL
ncbi:MAG TPA: hypothetical protein PLD86_14835, partial [Vicinamibacteria bacterium]|nr:hypothetical protein [Vicinamibacteria bacterium]